MARLKFLFLGLASAGFLILIAMPDSAWARRDVSQDECLPNVRCPAGEITPDFGRENDRSDTSDDSSQDDVSEDDTSQDDSDDSGPIDTAPE